MQERLKARALVLEVRVYYPLMGWFVLLIHRDKNTDNDVFDNYSEGKYHDPAPGCEQQLNNAAHHPLVAWRAKKQQTLKNRAAKNTEMLPAHRQNMPHQECLLGFFQRFALS